MVVELVEKRPLKVKNLKIIDYVGTLYATFDGTKMWEMDKLAFEVLKLCDGTRTFDQIADNLAKRAELDIEDVKNALKPMFKELEELKFIDYV